ncbi:MAG: 2-dehydropantoate 2-reductase [Pseudomonadota bacterium]
MTDARIVVAGAGSIGCFVGGTLLAAGRSVSFLGRDRIAEELNGNGLRLTDYTGMEQSVSADKIAISTDPTILQKAEVVFVTVKSGATQEMAELIREHTKTSATIVSLQNGISNSETLRDTLKEFDVRAGMVPFNVVQKGNGHFHRATSGDIKVEQGNPEMAELLDVKHLKTIASKDMNSILWGKLLINLNNALNALHGGTLVEQLSDRDQRRRMADQMKEGLKVIKAEGISPNPPAPVPAWVIPHILRLPTPLFRLAAKQMLTIDPQARSSMSDDIELGRKTEIDELQGAIVMLGKKHEIPTPMNEQVMAEIKKLEQRNEERDT